MKKTKKTFDCIAYKQKAQEEIYERTKGLNPPEEVAWYRDQARAGPFRRFIECSIQAAEVRNPRKAA